MPFVVRGFHNNNSLTLTSATAKDAFAKAIEWHLIERFTSVSISDGTKDYTIAEFSLAMALNDVSTTLDTER
jgi:hypothetical protein